MEEDKKKDPVETFPEEEKKNKEEEVEDEELFADEEEFNEEEEDTWEKTRTWIQDNLRVILSVLIVALIAVGIYNYSRKPATEEISQIDQIVGEQEVVPQENQNSETANIEVKDQAAQKDQVAVKNEQPAQPQPTNTNEGTAKPQQGKTAPQVETRVEKTVEGYTTTAGKGDGLTHLARQALKEYLAQNPDAAITKEHKIYIEDYMRRQIAQGRIHAGDTRVFSETLLKDTIGKSKQLNEGQLKNLRKYSARVTNL